MKTTAVNQKEPPAHESNSGTIVFKSSIHRIRRGNGHEYSANAPSTPKSPIRRPARVAIMLAFAHKLQAAIDNGEYIDRADAARKLGLTRARVSQLLDLSMLAPDIQENILFMERVDGVEPTSERALRKMVAVPEWMVQRQKWAQLVKISIH